MAKLEKENVELLKYTKDFKDTKETIMKTNEKKMNIRKLTGTAMLSAIAYVLMFLEFPIPLIPSFIKMDFSKII